MTDRIISDERWQVGNADFAKIMMRIRERDRIEKMAQHTQEPEREEKTTYFREIVKGVLVLVAIYVTIMVVVGLVR